MHERSDHIVNRFTEAATNPKVREVAARFAKGAGRFLMDGALGESGLGIVEVAETGERRFRADRAFDTALEAYQDPRSVGERVISGVHRHARHTASEAVKDHIPGFSQATETAPTEQSIQIPSEAVPTVPVAAEQPAPFDFQGLGIIPEHQVVQPTAGMTPENAPRVANANIYHAV